MPLNITMKVGNERKTIITKQITMQLLSSNLYEKVSFSMGSIRYY